MFEGFGHLIKAISLVLDGAHTVVSIYLTLFLLFTSFYLFSFITYCGAVMPPVALLGCGVLVRPMSRY
jgi:hypothetical protein